MSSLEYVQFWMDSFPIKHKWSLACEGMLGVKIIMLHVSGGYGYNWWLAYHKEQMQACNCELMGLKGKLFLVVQDRLSKV